MRRRPPPGRAAAETEAPRVTYQDVALAAAVFAVQATLALTLPEAARSHRPDAAGWIWLASSAAVLTWRRRAPMWCVLAMIAVVAPYHYLENIQDAPVLSSMIALYSLAVAGPPIRTFLVVPTMVGTMAVVMSAIGKPTSGTPILQGAGWVVAVAVAGELVRMHRNYIAAIMERAERAERTREEEAARRVAEERLRIARDLHDLLAHSITLIGVQTSVAAHILLADPERLDRTAVAGALDNIAETCREARSELRTTLRVLRADSDGPLPDLAGIPALARAAEAAGARVTLVLDTDGEPVPAAVGAAAYRIVQESLTNAVRHTGAPDPRVRVAVGHRGVALHVCVEDEGPEAVKPPAADRPEGFGIVGMRERARSVGGTFAAGPRTDGKAGFSVTAVLPCASDPSDRDAAARSATDPARTGVGADRTAHPAAPAGPAAPAPADRTAAAPAADRTAADRTAAPADRIPAALAPADRTAAAPAADRTAADRTAPAAAPADRIPAALAPADRTAAAPAADRTAADRTAAPADRIPAALAPADRTTAAPAADRTAADRTAPAAAPAGPAAPAPADRTAAAPAADRTAADRTAPAAAPAERLARADAARTAAAADRTVRAAGADRPDPVPSADPQGDRT
ncbi:sensor histidine kinase [Streptomyces sp. NPDC049040]|uniref:sensor histidine kinase n=1 Tax=Streptomyces sp. NPDC049040 TaxID=3365593 RepID=UPI0037152212